MSPVQPFLPTAEGTRPSAAVFLSGSGSNALRILERWESLADACSYDVSVLVTDAPETSRARELGRTFGLPVVENDIRLALGVMQNLDFSPGHAPGPGPQHLHHRFLAGKTGS